MSDTYSDFDMPRVIALMNPNGRKATVFVPNPWSVDRVLIRTMTRDEDGIWRFHCGAALTTMTARTTWKHLVAEGCTTRDVIKEPLNNDNRPAVDLFATNFSMATTRFAYLADLYRVYPRKINA